MKKLQVTCTHNGGWGEGEGCEERGGGGEDGGVLGGGMCGLYCRMAKNCGNISNKSFHM